MRILQAIQKFSNTTDNVSTTEIIFNISKILSDRGHEVTIYTTNYKLDNQKIQDLKKHGVKFYISKIFADVGGFIITPGIIFDFSIIKQYDIIHLHNYRTFQNVIISFLANLFKIPYILQAEGSLTTFYQKKYSKILFDYVFWKRLILSSTKIIAASEQETIQLINMGVPKDKIVIIPFAIDIKDYTHLPEKGLFKRKNNINQSKRIILYLGRIHERKGLEILLLAFSDIQKDDADTVLVIAGPDDGYLADIYDLIEKLHLKDRIIIPGPLYDSDKIEAYRDADIFVLPSYHDDFGLTTLESLACGTPVIITNRCGSSDVVRRYGGLVVDYDKNSLVKGIKTLLSDDNLRIKYSEQGKAFVQSHYSWNSIGDMLETCYNSCLSKE
jgi:glycosyltransferase involved in cell wall biosynthesis